MKIQITDQVIRALSSCGIGLSLEMVEDELIIGDRCEMTQISNPDPSVVADPSDEPVVKGTRLGKVFVNPEYHDELLQSLLELSEENDFRRCILIGRQHGEVAYALSRKGKPDVSVFHFGEHGDLKKGIEAAHRLERQDVDVVVVVDPDADFDLYSELTDLWVSKHLKNGGHEIFVSDSRIDGNQRFLAQESPGEYAEFEVSEPEADGFVPGPEPASTASELPEKWEGDDEV